MPIHIVNHFGFGREPFTFTARGTFFVFPFFQCRRCGVEIGVPVIERLRARYPHVAHIKEAGGSVDRVDQILSALGNDITVLSGDDSLTLPLMAIGGRGVISVVGNLVPRDMKAMIDAFDSGNLAETHAPC